MHKLNMTREERDKWLTRLRDPNSNQIRETLHSSDFSASCCLGHLCVVLNPDYLSWDQTSEQKDADVSDDQYLFVRNKLNDPVQRDENGNIEHKILSRLVDMNDSEDYSLPEIADWIEENTETHDG